MRIANLSGRLVLITGGRAVDVAKASEGRFGSDPQAIYDRWAEFRSWAGQADVPAGAEFDAADLGAPAPAFAHAPGTDPEDRHLGAGRHFAGTHQELP